MASDPNYLCIRKDIISKFARCSDQDLQRFKDKFENVIKSKRTLSYIGDVEELVRTVEKRYALNEQQIINCLMEIATSNKNYSLHPRIHSAVLSPIVQDRPVLNSVRMSPREQIYELILNEIGNKWKQLARHLAISEGKIDELDTRYFLDPPERIREILKYYQSANADNWYPLLNALGQSRRLDLRNKVEQILSKHESHRIQRND